MVEIALTPFEKKYHPAADGDHLIWWGANADFWFLERGFIEYATKLQLDTLQLSIEDAIDLIAIAYNAPQLRSLIVDIQLCGSYAYGIQQPGSDFDIQLAAKNYEDQRKIEAIIVNKSSLIKIVGYQLSLKIKHRIEMHYSVHNNKENGVEFYSLRERKLYNRQEGVPTAQKHKRRFKSKKDVDDKEIGKYEIIERVNPTSLIGDYWDIEGRLKI